MGYTRWEIHNRPLEFHHNSTLFISSLKTKKTRNYSLRHSKENVDPNFAGQVIHGNNPNSKHAAKDIQRPSSSP